MEERTWLRACDNPRYFGNGGVEDESWFFVLILE